MAILVAVVVSALALFLAPRPARSDRVDDLSRTLESETDEKARIAAAVALGRLADRRSVPVLMRALSDKNPVVRGIAANALGHIGDPQAIPALERAVGTETHETVRARVRDSLARLRPAPPKVVARATPSRVSAKERPRLDRNSVHVVVKTAVDQTRRGPREMPAKMRAQLVDLLRGSPNISVDGDGVSTNGGGHFVLDASVTSIDRTTDGVWVEVSCQVRFALSTSEGRIVSIVTGGAKVQTPRQYFRPKMEKGLQMDALDNAVRGAHQNLVAFLARQVATK